MTKKHAPPPFAPLRVAGAAGGQPSAVQPKHDAAPRVKHSPPPLAPMYGLKNGGVGPAQPKIAAPAARTQPPLPAQKGASPPHRGLLQPKESRPMAPLGAPLRLTASCCGNPAHGTRAIQKMEKGTSFSFGASESLITNSAYFFGQQGTTFASMIDNSGNVGTYKNNKSKKYGKEHAEDVWLRAIIEGIDEGRFVDDERNQVILTVTASPCTSERRGIYPSTSNKTKGCTEELLDFVRYGINRNGNNYYFVLTIICEHLYQPKGKGEGVKEASKLALQALESVGVDCRVQFENDYEDRDEDWA